ncbi:MAG: hypothetical protein RL708_1982 [Bacteroidota bacterium]|jgi:hypothetical protein
MKRLLIYVFACSFLISKVSTAESIYNLKSVNPQNHFGTPKNAKADGCPMPTASVDLDINNVRARIMDAGDMWWDRGLEVARYEVPKIDPPGSAPSVSSLFAGAIWVGGIDNSGNLRVAAQTYRQNGNDFFAGPLSSIDGTVDATTCTNYDYFWKINGADIIKFKAASAPVSSDFPTIFGWPAKNNATATGANGATLLINDELAPWVDVNGDGTYDAATGDYPSFGGANANTLPDQMIFWVYNDKGNIHTETSSDPIGLQINAMAFAFKTSDDVNSMTFYRYDLYNKSTNNLDSTYIAQWLDPDLGCAKDDYIGSDPVQGLGICYNADANDEPCPNGYGANIPMVGIDFFEGPKIRNFNNTKDTTLGMTGFYYFYNSTPSGLADPQSAVQFYGYMTGTWRDGTRFTQGGNAHGGTQRTNYVFPDAPNKSGNNVVTGQPYWSMCNPTPVTPGDVRIVESSGPFKLIPGSKQRVTVGVVWVPSISYPCPSFQKILTADATAQALFDAGFAILKGPAAPDLSIQEYDKELILTISNNSPTSNNYKEKYKEFSSKIMPQVIKVPGSPTSTDSLNASYIFEGYQVYQLKDNFLPSTEDDYHDATKMRLIAQVDKKNSVKNIVNWFRDDANGGGFKPILEAAGTDEGITHTFQIKTDKFASGDDQFLVNFKSYYFLVVAYGYNNYKDYSDADPSSQSTPYIRGNANVYSYTGIPHIITPQHGGTVLHSKFGDQPFITRVEGYGNGYNFTNLAQSTINEILNNVNVDKLKYDSLGGPINVRIFDPVRVPKDSFEVSIIDSSKYWINGAWDSSTPTAPKDSVRKFAYWKIVNISSGETRYSEKDISSGYDQLFQDWGFSVNIEQSVFAGTKKNITANVGTPQNPQVVLLDIRNYAQNNGFLGWDLKVNSAVNFWYGQQAADQDGEVGTNWIRSGTTWKLKTASPAESWRWSDYAYGNGSYVDAYDKDQDYEKIFGGTWAPFMLAAYDVGSVGTDFTKQPVFNYEAAIIPGFDEQCMKNHKMSDLFSFDIVFTSDKSKWTKSAVVNTKTNPKDLFASGAIIPSTDRLRLSTHDSWLDYTSLDANGNPKYDASSQGLSWFPGYAINIETGERLNIVFGEDNKAVNDNGNDLLWNPTSTTTKEGFGRYGGRHYIYILKTKYDVQKVGDMAAILGSGNVPDIRDSIYTQAIWVGVPMMLNTGGLYTMKSAKEGIIPADLTLKVRVSKPYGLHDYGNNTDHPGYPKFTFSMKDFAADTSVMDTAKSALDLINIVPNPYYAYSNYETGTLDSKVKITNLPKKCTITIYTVDGTLIRQFKRDIDYPTYQDWDLKNSVSVPIASGLYLIHISADGLGKNHDQAAQRVIKWFGVMRQIDLNTF